MNTGFRVTNLLLHFYPVTVPSFYFWFHLAHCWQLIVGHQGNCIFHNLISQALHGTESSNDTLLIYLYDFSLLYITFLSYKCGRVPYFSQKLFDECYLAQETYYSEARMFTSSLGWEGRKSVPDRILSDRYNSEVDVTFASRILIFFYRATKN